MHNITPTTTVTVEDTWQEYYNSEGHNMEGCWLYGVDFSYENLDGANLSNTFMSWQNWEDQGGVNLTNFYFTSLQGANFTGARAFGAYFTEADLRYANLQEANLSNLAGFWGECEQTEGIIDENADGYDDVSYDAGAESGDLNLDGVVDILDAVKVINIIVGNP
jgi:uncharacterized protein YjbI with pentapeptide repeats